MVRLVFVQYFPLDLLSAISDAYDAIRSGASRAPFLSLSFSATLQGSQAHSFLGISDKALSRGEDELFGLGVAFGGGEKEDSRFLCWRRLDRLPP